MVESPPPAMLHWQRDHAAYMRLKRRESRLRETSDCREARLAAARAYRRLHVDHTSLERGKRYFTKRRQSAYARLHDGLSSEIWKALRTRKAGRKWETIVGYTLEALVRHLERQFYDGMSWGNYGSAWQVDHIIPLAYFQRLGWTDDLVRVAWALSNLRPLPPLENIRKGAQRLHLL